MELNSSRRGRVRDVARCFTILMKGLMIRMLCCMYAYYS